MICSLVFYFVFIFYLVPLFLEKIDPFTVGALMVIITSEMKEEQRHNHAKTICYLQEQTSCCELLLPTLITCHFQ